MSGKTAVIGGGAAGLMAASLLAQNGACVTVYEKNEYVGRKLGITGKGRCNLTNDCTLDEFLKNIPTNPRFLYSAFNAFPPSEVMNFFESRGVRLKVERGNRVFPESDRAADIVNALRHIPGCNFIHEKVRGISEKDGVVSGIMTESGFHEYDNVVVCTGGKSYPRTGSDGDGYAFASRLGLEVVMPEPSLVPLETKEKWCAELQGLSLKNVSLRMTDTLTQKTVYEDFGEMMFTHFGVTGPMILSASAHIKTKEPERYRIKLDLKPALDEKTLDRRLLADFAQFCNRDLINSLSMLLPQKLIPVAVRLSNIPPHKKINSLTKEERAALVYVIKNLELTVLRTRPVDEAIVTRGGVSVKELDPKTMECKRIQGLYFCGEVIDVDAYTGGFNLQIAFCTAACAANAILRK
ncbi:MAG: NAD(P)/FAD-dependent oxidoreductase [Firmicutes bacterium]|nr:NAD(P)/FAD-dependent oxidoreductase [Bacillota bacterium]